MDVDVDADVGVDIDMDIDIHIMLQFLWPKEVYEEKKASSPNITSTAATQCTHRTTVTDACGWVGGWVGGVCVYAPTRHSTKHKHTPPHHTTNTNNSHITCRETKTSKAEPQPQPQRLTLAVALAPPPPPSRGVSVVLTSL